jgi:hypothetical protein
MGATAPGNLTRRLFLGAAAASPLAATEPWERRPFPEWSAEVGDQLLTDSPWAKQLTVPFQYVAPVKQWQSDWSQVEIPGVGWPRGRTPGGPRPAGTGRGGNPVPFHTEVYLVIRWSSALPIRQALALAQWGRERLREAEAAEFLSREEPDYLLGVGGFPTTMVPQGAAWLEQELIRSARVWFKDRRPLRATAAHVPEHGNHLAAELRFPRIEGGLPGDGVVEFTAEAGPIKMAQKFRLKAMFYHGRLEL